MPDQYKFFIKATANDFPLLEECLNEITGGNEVQEINMDEVNPITLIKWFTPQKKSYTDLYFSQITELAQRNIPFGGFHAPGESFAGNMFVAFNGEIAWYNHGLQTDSILMAYYVQMAKKVNLHFQKATLAKTEHFKSSPILSIGMPFAGRSK